MERKGIFLSFKNVFNIDRYASGLYWDALAYSGFENKTVLFIFQLWQLGDSECTEVFEITEYPFHLENKTSCQYSNIT